MTCQDNEIMLKRYSLKHHVESVESFFFFSNSFSSLQSQTSFFIIINIVIFKSLNIGRAITELKIMNLALSVLSYKSALSVLRFSLLEYRLLDINNQILFSFHVLDKTVIFFSEWIYALQPNKCI